MKRDIFFKYKYEKVAYAYMLIRYCMHNILANMDKNKNVTIRFLLFFTPYDY